MERRTPSGVIVPIATPMTSTGELDEPALANLLGALIPHVDGVLALGSSGEFPWLTDRMARQVRAVIQQVAGGQISVLVGAGGTSLDRTMDLVTDLADDAPDFAVVTAPYYYPVDQAALVDYFAVIADRSPVPIVIYNIPQNTANAVTFATVRELSQHPNIRGIKDSSGDFFAFMRFLDARSDTFTVLQGREQLLVPSLYAGCDGTVSSLGNLAPAMLQRARTLVASGERAEALALQREITSLAELFDHGYWLSALKAALGHRGFAVGAPAKPLPMCTPAESERIGEILASCDSRWLIGEV